MKWKDVLTPYLPAILPIFSDKPLINRMTKLTLPIFLSLTFPKQHLINLSFYVPNLLLQTPNLRSEVHLSKYMKSVLIEFWWFLILPIRMVWAVINIQTWMGQFTVNFSDNTQITLFHLYLGKEENHCFLFVEWTSLFAFHCW